MNNILFYLKYVYNAFKLLLIIQMNKIITMIVHKWRRSKHIFDKHKYYLSINVIRRRFTILINE